MAEAVPPWMRFAGEGDYAAGLVDLVGSVTPEAVSVYAEGVAGYVSTPIAAQVVSLTAAFEEATGLEIAQLVNVASSIVTLSRTTDPNAIISATADLMNGVAGAASSAARAAGVGASVVSTIPLIASFVEVFAAIADEVVASQQRIADLREACQDAADENRNVFCAELVRDSKPRPTGRQTSENPSGLDPTDLFRPLAYEWRRPGLGRLVGTTLRHYGAPDVGGMPAQFPPVAPLLVGEVTSAGRQAYSPLRGQRAVYDPRPAFPPLMASIFLGLCGGLSSYPDTVITAPRDARGVARAPWSFDPWFRYNKQWKAAAWRPPAVYLEWCKSTGTEPIPEHVRRRIWAAVRTLMVGARDPTPSGEGGSIMLQDGGRAVMAILVDLVNEQRHRGTVTPELIETISWQVLEWTRYKLKCDTSGEVAAHAPVEGYAWCPDRIDLATPFLELLDSYDSQLRFLAADLAAADSRSRNRRRWEPGRAGALEKARKRTAGAAVATSGAALVAGLIWRFAGK